jgi:hypothetical protein
MNPAPQDWCIQNGACRVEKRVSKGGSERTRNPRERLGTRQPPMRPSADILPSNHRSSCTQFGSMTLHRLRSFAKSGVMRGEEIHPPEIYSGINLRGNFPLFQHSRGIQACHF